jgi:hypothetical protein
LLTGELVPHEKGVWQLILIARKGKKLVLLVRIMGITVNYHYKVCYVRDKATIL